MPVEFSDVSLMSATGWSWRELQETPAETVHLMSIYITIKNATDNKQSRTLEDWPE